MSGKVESYPSRWVGLLRSFASLRAVVAPSQSVQLHAAAVFSQLPRTTAETHTGESPGFMFTLLELNMDQGGSPCVIEEHPDIPPVFSLAVSFPS